MSRAPASRPLLSPSLSVFDDLNGTLGTVIKMLTSEQGDFAMSGFVGLAITRFPADWLRTRMWALRHHLSGYDATHVALAKMTAAAALLATDARLARARGIKCSIQSLSAGHLTANVDRR